MPPLADEGGANSTGDQVTAMMNPATQRLPFSREFRSRVLVSVVLVPIVGLGVWLGGWYIAVLAAAAAGLAAHEFFRLVEPRAGMPLGWMGIPAAVILVFLAASQHSFEAWSGLALSVLMLLGLAVAGFATVTGDRDKWLVSAVLSVSGVLYTGCLLSFGLLLRQLPEVRAGTATGPADGFLLVMLPVTVTCSTDVGSYFVGKALGRRRLAARVSPGKTVEGCIGGLVGATVAGYAVGLLLSDIDTVVLSAPACALMGFTLGVFAQVGDLAQSMLKREAGVKHSGTLLRGHGGVLDRLDSHLFTLPLAYGLVVLSQLLV